MKRRILEMIVGGKRIKKDLEKIMSITDVDLDMRNIAEELSYWGRLYARADAIKITAEAKYRNWRATMAKQMLEEKKKRPPSEWKVRAEIESSRTFLEMKKQIAVAHENAETLNKIYDSLKTKSFMLPNVGARERDLNKATGMSTPKKGK